MTDWFRSWHGAPTDPKWVLIARKAGCTPATAAAIGWALFDHASQCVTRGDVRHFDCEVYAAWGGIEEEVVRKAIAAMEEKRMIVDGMLSAWDKRQPNREDNSSDRTAAYRERKRLAAQSQERIETPSERTVTHCDAPDTESDTEKERKKELASLVPKKARASQIPKGIGLDDAMRSAADKCGLARDRQEREFSRFVDHHQAKGSVMVDWTAAWRTWCRNALAYQARASPLFGLVDEKGRPTRTPD